VLDLELNKPLIKQNRQQASQEMYDNKLNEASFQKSEVLQALTRIDGTAQGTTMHVAASCLFSLSST
jgi:flagellar biosynthesis regulator FlbT